MRNTQIADSARKAFVQGLMLQVVLLVLSALMLDGGYTLRVYGTALVAQLVTTGGILYRRPSEPTRADLVVIRFGILPLWAIAHFAAPWIARLMHAASQMMVVD